MFSSTALFRQIACPGGLGCGLPNCIFSHDANELSDGGQQAPLMQRSLEEDKIEEDLGNVNGPRKRRRVDVKGNQGEFEGSQTQKPLPAPSPTPASASVDDDANGSTKHKTALSRTSNRVISPPPLRGRNVASRSLEISERLGC
ncbi:MAG: hypothetical protein M1830_005451, partial [Pleopsidium flavum]